MRSKERKLTIEDTLYYIGLALLFPLFVAGPIVVNLLLPQIGLPDKKCMLLMVAGIYCPGCGGTRAIISLYRGKIWESFCYHPMVIYGFIIYLIYMLTHTMERLHVGRIKGIKFRPIYLYGALIILVVNFWIKNILKLCFGIFMQ